jgi:membrane protease YdiL (CAAX protease family)
VVVPGLAFGLAHAGYLNQGFLPWLGLMLPIALMGMMWGTAYLLGRRSLIPAIVTHFLNNATAVPRILFFMGDWPRKVPLCRQLASSPCDDVFRKVHSWSLGNSNKAITC